MKKSLWRPVGLVGVVFLLAAFLVAGCASPEAPVAAENPGVTGSAAALNYRDGIVEAVSQGNERGYLKITLTLKNNEVVDAAIVEYDGVGVEKIYEDYGVRFPQLEEAHAALAGNMVRENTWDVDVFTGATSTSEKAREAARFALEKASVKAAGSAYLDGTFMAISDVTERGWGIAWVTVENDRVADVILEGTTPAQKDGVAVFDTVGRQVFTIKPAEYPHAPYHEAKSVIADNIIASQRPQVDTYTGATGSSSQWLQAVERAMAWAKIR
jgi:uncharacterized protein with FMN-binding domain